MKFKEAPSVVRAQGRLFERIQYHVARQYEVEDTTLIPSDADLITIAGCKPRTVVDHIIYESKYD